MTQVRVSIIIPALNEAAYIGQAVDRAMATQPLEVIVVDGCSYDNTATLAADHGANVLTSPPGRAIQLNRGAQHAQGDVLLFLHADNWLDKSGLMQIATACENSAVLGGAFRQHIEAPGWTYRLLEQGNSLRARWQGLPYGDQGIFLRQEIFHQLHGFPEVALMEDLLFMRRIRRLSKPLLLPGPLYVSPRRWEQHGAVRQTLKNWLLTIAERLGIPTDTLARFYPSHEVRHDPSAQPNRTRR